MNTPSNFHLDAGDEPANSGSVLSNRDTITALREGVEIDLRTDVITVKDASGAEHEVPVALQQKGADISVTVMRDVVDEAAARAVGPRRRDGSVELLSIDSLVEYVNRYKGANAVAFAQLDPPGITVVFDYHPAGADAAGWRRDRAVYTCPLSRQWELWTERDGEEFAQVAFGDFLEQNADDIHGNEDEGIASAAKMLEVARHLVIHHAGKFERKIDPTSGTGTFTVVDDHGPQSTKIPKAFGLAIPVFEGSEDLYPVECRVRFSLPNGRPAFAFIMHNREQVFEHATKKLREDVAKRCGIPVFVGNAPTAATK